MIQARQTLRQTGIRQQSLGPHSRLGRATALVFVLVSGVTLALSDAAEAQTWDGETSADWTVGTNWNPDGAPAVVDTATIAGNGANAPEVLVDTSVTVEEVEVTGGTLTVRGELIANSFVNVSGTGVVRVEPGVGSNGVLSGLVNIDPGGTLSVAGLIDGTVRVNAGTLELDGGTIDDGTPTHTIEIQQGGIVRAISDSTLDGPLIDVIANETGTITAADGVTLTIASGEIARRIDSTMTFGTAGVAGTVVIAPTSGVTIGNNSVVNIAGGTLQVGTAFAGSVFFNSGLNISTSVDSGATIDVNGFNTTIRRLSGAGTITNDGAAAATVTLNNPTGGNTDFSGVIENGTSAVAVTKAGAGTMTLSGNNTYSGVTTVNAGTLAVTGSIESLQVRVNADGTLVADGAALADLAAVRVDGEMELTGNEEIGSLDGGGTVSLGAFTLTTGGNDTNTSFSGDMTGTGGLVKTGTGTMTLTGANSFDGSTTVNEGVLAVTGANGSLDSTSIFVTDTGTLTADGNALSFGAAVTVEDTGTFTLTGFESYTSLTQEGGTVNGGGVHTLSGAFTQNGGTTGGTVGITAGSVTQNGGTIASGTLVTSGGAKTLDGGTINGTLSGSGVTTVQTGTTNLDGSIVGGETRIATGGVLNLTGDSEVTTLVLTGGELTASADATLTGSGVGVFGEGESGTISAADGVTLTLASTFFVRGAGLPVGAPDTTVTFGSEGNEGTVVIATTAFGRVGDNSSVVIAEGTVMVGSTQAGQSAFSNDIFLATGVTTTVDATLDLNGFNTSVSNLSGEGEITNSDAAAAVLTLQNDQQSTFDGVIADGTGAISVVKVQGSRQILTADQAHTGTTTVNAGILQAGDGGTAGSFGAGTIILNAPGTATVNRSDDFTMANLIAGTGALVNAGTGTTRLTGANTFTGGLTVSAGTVALERGAALADTNAVTVELNAILELTDSERMGALTNRGTVDLSSGNGRAGTVLTVNGNYTAASDLRMDVVLGGDASATDLMVVEGNTSGATNVVVVNQGGTGATTTTGIRLVDVQGTSAGSFVLANTDMTLESGEAGISAGNYVYLLRQVAGDWFLQSQFQSFAVAYDALPSALLGMTQTASLMQRLAGRVPLTPASSGAPSVTASTSGGGGAAPTGLWFNLRAADADVTPAGSTTALSYGQSTWRLQAGYDLEVAATPNGTWVLGASAFRGGSELNATSAIGSGTINSDARGLGLTATWYGTSGVYTDIQLEYARFKTDVTSPVDGLLASDVDGSGRFASVEVGKAFALQNGLTLTPQAQLSWASVKMDSFTGSTGGAVTVGETDSLKLRLGLAAERGWTTATGESGRVYGIANVTREFRGDTSVSLDGDALTTDAVDVTGELGVGLSYDWQNAGKTSSLFGQVEVSRDLSGGDLTAVSGTAGLRIRW